MLLRGGDVLNALAEGDVAGHGEGEAGVVRGLGDIAKGVGVGGGVGAVGEEVCVASILALGQEDAPHPPDGGVKPVEEAGEGGQGGKPEVTALEV